MIKFSKIDEELNVYKNAEKIVLFGTGSAGVKLFNILMYFGIEADLFSDNNENKWNGTVCGKKIISPTELKAMYDEDSRILINVITSLM